MLIVVRAQPGAVLAAGEALRRCFHAAYGRLRAGAQRAVRALGVFAAAPWGVAALAAVLGVSRVEALAAAGELQAAGWITPALQAGDRLEMHRLLHAFAVSLAADDAERGGYEERHAGEYARRMEAVRWRQAERDWVEEVRRVWSDLPQVYRAQAWAAKRVHPLAVQLFLNTRPLLSVMREGARWEVWGQDALRAARAGERDLSGEDAYALYTQLAWGYRALAEPVLARAVAGDEEVERYFRSGVLWAELGPEGEPRRWLERWCELLKLPLRGDETVWELQRRVGEFLSAAEHRFLLVIDDVWRAEDLEPLLVEGPQSRVLITTRERHPLQKLGVDDCVIEIGMMREEEALELVRLRLGARWQEGESSWARERVRLVDGLPLAVQLWAAVVKRRGWGYVLHRLRRETGAINVLALSKAERREHSLRLTLDLSYESLSGWPREVLEMLGVLAPGVEFTHWDVDFGWMELSAALARVGQQGVLADALLELVDGGLVLEVEAGRRYRMHSLVGHYAAEKLAGREDAQEIWKQYIGHAVDTLSMGLRGGGLSPRAGAQLVEERWPHIRRAWGRPSAPRLRTHRQMPSCSTA